MKCGFRSKVKNLTAELIHAGIVARASKDAIGKPDHPMTTDEFITWCDEISKEYKCDLVFSVCPGLVGNRMEMFFNAEFKPVKLR